MYSDIPASEGGTVIPYTPSTGDLGLWLRAEVTFDVTFDSGGPDEVTETGRTAIGVPRTPVLSRPVVSNAGFAHFEDILIYANNRLRVTHPVAQGFTTGPDSRGYLLVRVLLSLYVHEGTPIGAWAVHADDGGKPAAAPLFAPVPLPDISNALESYEELVSRRGLRLQAGTRYWIVVSLSNPEAASLGFSAWNPWSGVFRLLNDLGQFILPSDFRPEDYANPWTGPTYSGFDLEGNIARIRASSPIDPGSEAGWSLNLPALSLWNREVTLKDPQWLPYGPLGSAIGLPPHMAVKTSIEVAPDVTVEFAAAEQTAPEGGEVNVELRLSQDPRRTVTVPITATGENGAIADDFMVPQSVTFHSGETSKTITLRAVDDELDDDDETVKLELGEMPDEWITAGARTATTVRIADDDDPFVTATFERDSYDADEGGEQEVKVSLNADPERELIIPIAPSHLDGLSADDYSGLPDSISFNIGQTEQSFTIMVTDDDLDDDDERLLLAFGEMPDERVSAGLTAETVINIGDDDDPHVTVEYGQDSQNVGEDETVNVTVRLSADPERTLAIPLTATGEMGATAADYTAPASVSFSAGQVEQTVAFMATPDTVNDDDERVKLGFGSNLPARVTLGARTTTTLNIGDDDDPEVTVQFALSSLEVAEGADEQVTVNLSADPERSLIIPLTPQAVGGVSEDDYSGLPASVSFSSGQTSASFTFRATDDLIDDDDEGVTVRFGTMPDPRVSAGATSEIALTIDDNDTAGVLFSPTALTVDEEDDAEYGVTLATEPTENVSVTLTGTADTGLSLHSGRLSNGALSFSPLNWNSPQMVTVRAAHDDDGVADHDTLLHEAAGGEYDGVEAELSVTTDDNDPLGIVFEPLALTVPETDAAGYTVRLATEPTAPVSLTVTGHAGTDLTLSGESLANDMLSFTAANWRTPQTVTVAAAFDEDREDDAESLMHSASGVEYEGLSDVLPVTIDDNTGDLRLVGGTLVNEDGEFCEGRLEIYYQGQWGLICNDYWSRDDADVACRQLGFAGGDSDDWSGFEHFFPRPPRDQNMWLDDVGCTGGESNLLDCPARPLGDHNCSPREAVGLRCLKTTGPWIVNIEFSQPAADDGRYVAGETVEITLVWSEAITLLTTPHGYPRVALSYGGRIDLLYAPTGSGTDRMVYTHTLTSSNGESSFDFIEITHDSLGLRDTSNLLAPSGGISSLVTGRAAVLGHRDHRSDEPGATASTAGGQREATRVVGAPGFSNEPGDDGLFGAGETIELTFSFSQAVEVDITGGTPSVEILLGGSQSRRAAYLRGGGTTQLVFGYTLTDSDGEHNTLILVADSLALNGGAIRDAEGHPADLSHLAAGALFLPAPDQTAPQLESVSVDGAVITLDYDETPGQQRQPAQLRLRRPRQRSSAHDHRHRVRHGHGGALPLSGGGIGRHSDRELHRARRRRRNQGRPGQPGGLVQQQCRDQQHRRSRTVPQQPERAAVGRSV